MIKNILIFASIIVAMTVTGCVDYTPVATNITLQDGEALFYVRGHPGWTDEASSVGEAVENFSATHNVSRVEMQYANGNLAGAYIIYRK